MLKDKFNDSELQVKYLEIIKLYKRQARLYNLVFVFLFLMIVSASKTIGLWFIPLMIFWVLVFLIMRNAFVRTALCPSCQFQMITYSPFEKVGPGFGYFPKKCWTCKISFVKEKNNSSSDEK